MEGVQGKPGIEERSHGNEYGTNMAACFTYAFLLCCNLTTYALLIERREWGKGHLAGIGGYGRESTKRATDLRVDWNAPHIYHPSMEEIVRLRAFCGGREDLRHCNGERHRTDVDDSGSQPAQMHVWVLLYVCLRSYETCDEWESKAEYAWVKSHQAIFLLRKKKKRNKINKAKNSKCSSEVCSKWCHRKDRFSFLSDVDLFLQREVHCLGINSDESRVGLCIGTWYILLLPSTASFREHKIKIRYVIVQLILIQMIQSNS